MIKQYTFKSITLLTLSIASMASMASSAIVPNTFTSGTAAVAADVNENFTSLKTAIDDNNGRVTSLETNEASVLADVTAHDARLTSIEVGVISIPPAAFVENSNGCDYTIETSRNYGYIKSGAPGNCQLIAPVYLPHGRSMTGLTCYLRDNEAPSDFDISLRQHDMTEVDPVAGSVGVYSLTTNFHQDSSVIMRTDTIIDGSPSDDVIDNNTYHYQLRVNIDNVFTGGDSLSIYGCTVSYQ